VQTVLLELMPKVFVVTPNIPEAEALSGVRITSPASARRAAERLHQIGAGNVIIKGGHGAVPLNDDRGELTITDLLFDGSDFHELTERRSAGGSIRGTGCSHSAALAASLASGRGLRDSARDAQRHVARLIADAASR
jgi:hydroxymethylpyrimidine/phosphomethylpyrimidine kinase